MYCRRISMPEFVRYIQLDDLLVTMDQYVDVLLVFTVGPRPIICRRDQFSDSWQCELQVRTKHCFWIEYYHLMPRLRQKRYAVKAASVPALIPISALADLISKANERRQTVPVSCILPTSFAHSSTAFPRSSSSNASTSSPTCSIKSASYIASKRSSGKAEGPVRARDN